MGKNCINSYLLPGNDSGLIIIIAGQLTFAIVFAMIPCMVNRLENNLLTPEQMISIISVGWLILAVANVSFI
ncbi:hypothetical protein DYD21_04875 [Rhodohalobacter sp. SW132]|uniref:hypothetical protein n=1 Tax=Rhodohalobacter sp. SW132 TaxID=2293433 RepID=UPI000E265AEA|nr:hypothetical protein [Rhodohalobacter sp. SW132]REL37952.1 hypothetical protein DYD21_04875 [Rhodohalobacter sp. SW132]